MRHAALGAALLSLNPSLDGVRFCPRCGARADIEAPRSITCPHCGYGLYFNPKPVATRLIGVYSHARERVIVVVYAGKALGTPALTEEALEIGVLAPSDIPWRELAFSSDERALRAHLDAGAG